MKLKGMSEREIAMIFVGFLIGRVHVIDMSPFVVSFFMAICKERLPLFWYFAGLEVGIVGEFGIRTGVLYGVVLLLCALGSKVLEQIGQKALLWYSLVGAISVWIINYAGQMGQAVGRTEQMLWMLESSLVAIFTIVIHRGIYFFMSGNKITYAGNEEMISLLFLAALCIFGMPFQNAMVFDSVELCIALLILVVAYRYGAAAGSMSGAVCGIFYLAMGQGMDMLGILTVLGLAVGAFRELGKLVSVGTFLGIYGFSGVWIQEMLLAQGRIRAVVVACFLFVLLPRRYVEKTDGMVREQEYEEVKEQSTYQIQRRLERFAEPFFEMSRTFYQMAKQRENVQEKDMECVLMQVREQLCDSCEKRSYCLGKSRYQRFQTIGYLLPAVQEHGFVTVEDFPMYFLNHCDYAENYVSEINRALQLSYQEVQWQNRLRESRGALGEQFHEIGCLLREFSNSILQEHLVELEEKRELIMILKRNQVLVKRVEWVENNCQLPELHLVAKSRKHSCVTTRELAKCVSQFLCKNFVPGTKSKNVLGKEYEHIVLVQDTKYKVFTGVARTKKHGEECCGDNFSCMRLEHGRVVLALADGMGSGEKACFESTSVVELLESFLDVGVGEKTAIHLINSVLLLQGDYQLFSTLDMLILNLYTGICDFVKMGASAAFIRRKDRVETVSMDSLPVGVVSEISCEDKKRQLEDGDMVVLVSDGILECIPEVGREEIFKSRLLHLNMNNSQEIADTILQQAIVDCRGDIVDDMTVLVATLWTK
ncbi:MAG: SpoIIE family protein phosphatase [Lachnospiraceae bacterium]|nr:SpoIIE family protein phosphatase [Lachnospiraceae bacterium]